MTIISKEKEIEELEDIKNNKEKNEEGNIDNKYKLNAYYIKTNNKDMELIGTVCNSLNTNRNFIKIPERIYSQADRYEFINLVYFYFASHCGNNEIVSFTLSDICEEFQLQTTSSENANILKLKESIALLVIKDIAYEYVLPYGYSVYKKIKEKSPDEIIKQGIIYVNKDTKITTNEWVKNFIENTKPTDRLHFYFKNKRNPSYSEEGEYEKLIDVNKIISNDDVSNKFVPLYYHDINTILEYCFKKNAEKIYESKINGMKKEKFITPIKFLNIFIDICSYMTLNSILDYEDEENYFLDVNNGETLKSYVNVARIADDTGSDIKTVHKFILGLEEMKLLIVKRGKLKDVIDGVNASMDGLDKKYEDDLIKTLGKKRNIKKEIENETKDKEKSSKIYKKKNIYLRPFNPITNIGNYKKHKNK